MKKNINIQTFILKQVKDVKTYGVKELYRKFLLFVKVLLNIPINIFAPSGQFFNARYSKLYIGNFTEERFINIFKSERYKRIMDYIASQSFDAQTMMGTLPITHYANEALDNHIKGVDKISPQSGPKPLHVNFV